MSITVADCVVLVGDPQEEHLHLEMSSPTSVTLSIARRSADIRALPGRAAVGDEAGVLEYVAQLTVPVAELSSALHIFEVASFELDMEDSS